MKKINPKSEARNPKQIQMTKIQNPKQKKDDYIKPDSLIHSSTHSPIHSLSNQFIKSLTIRNLSKRTIKGLSWRLNRFFIFLNRYDVKHIDDITKDIITAYQVELYQQLNKQGQPNSIAYQNNLLSAVKLFMKYLKEHNYIVSDPSCDISYAKEPKRLPGWILTPREAKKIIQAPDTRTILGYRDRTILEVLYSTAIRKEELNNLTLADVDYNDGFLRIIKGKGKKDRIVPLGRIACRYLQTYIKSIRIELIRDPYNNYLFLSKRGNRLSKNIVWEIIKKYTQKVKIRKNVHPHTFRHSCATSMLKNKADLRVIQELLGHSSLTSTQIYTHINITDLKEIHKKCHPREKDN